MCPVVFCFVAFDWLEEKNNIFSVWVGTNSLKF
jgi:hypothetical protein